MRLTRFVAIVSAALASWQTPGFAESWPTYRHDNRRSGVTEERLQFPLRLLWQWKSPQPPRTAWSGPAKWDAYSGNRDLQSMRNFDPCFYVTADDHSVYFGSSADDAVHALEAATGSESWVLITGSAVRLPPTMDRDRLWFGSDDGYVYCCQKDSGQELWRTRAGPSGKRIVNDRKLISLWPVRTGVLVDRGRATFAGSLVPWERSYLVTVDASSGEANAPGCFRRELTEVTLQGALLASSQWIYAPQGRAAPLSFRRTDGQPGGSVGEAGGVFCILTEDEMLLAGPKDQKSVNEEIRIADLQSNRAIASFAGTNRILVDGPHAWLSIAGELKLLNRDRYVAAQQSIERLVAEAKQSGQRQDELSVKLEAAKKEQAASWRWTVPCPPPLDMIKAGDAIVVGLDGEVRAYSSEDGRPLWREPIDGAAHGLAVAAGRLFVSNDRGQIYAFGDSE
jgi:outer membrane protein assembly factor BamB